MRSMEAELETANRQVSDGEIHVLEQKRLIEKMRALGATTAQAEALLESLQIMLYYYKQRRDHIAAELAKGPDMPAIGPGAVIRSDPRRTT